MVCFFFPQPIESKCDTPDSQKFLDKYCNFILKSNIPFTYKSHTIHCKLKGVILWGLLTLTLDSLIKLSLITWAIDRIAKSFSIE